MKYFLAHIKHKGEPTVIRLVKAKDREEAQEKVENDIAKIFGWIPQVIISDTIE